MRFAADLMLERLARWMRLLGFDVEVVPEGDDGVVVESLAGSDRLLLTRDRELARRLGARAMYVGPDRVERQLEQVVGALGLDPEANVLSRCSLCNGPLENVAEGAAVLGLPPAVSRAGRRLWRCRGCGHLYWEGTHTDRIRREARRLKEMARVPENDKDCGPSR